MDQQILFNKSKINEDVLDELIGLPADIILERVGGTSIKIIRRMDISSE